jgi:uncharacterized protein YdhG (YjbR/CyaY superfamily)
MSTEPILRPEHAPELEGVCADPDYLRLVVAQMKAEQKLASKHAAARVRYAAEWLRRQKEG